MNNNKILIKSVEGINIDDLIGSYPENVWIQGPIAESRYKNLEGLIKGTDLRNADSTSTCKVLQKFLEDSIDVFLNDYAKQNSISFLKRDYQLVRYKKGQFFKEHTDATEEYPRKISVLLYLNDNYSGGEIIFTKLDLSIKPNKNTLIMFPSSEEFSHSAEPVESGVKYVVVGFAS